jgi:predicted nucleic acid-binding protein
MQNLISPLEDRVVLDTDVVSFVFKEKEQAKFFYPYLKNRILAISFITVGELYDGVRKDRWGNNRVSSLERFLQNCLILEYDYGLCVTWAEIKYDCEQSRHPIDESDCWIAASAIHYRCPLATNNARHFTHVKGLCLIAPSQA